MIDKLENWLGDQKDNLILWLPVFLGLGAAVYFGLKFEPSILMTSVLWAGSLSFLIAAFVLRHHPKAKLTWFFMALALFLAMTGFGLSKVKTEIVYTQLLLKETRPLMVEGNVLHTETLEGRKGSLIVLEDVTIESFAAEQTPRKLRLTSKMRSKVNPGDRLQILAKLTPPSMPVMPDAYDFRRHYFFDGIGAMGFVLKNPVVLKEAQSSQYGLFLERLRKSMGEHIKEVLPSRLSGIVTALVTGERAAIEDEDWDALRVSGLAHIISISGLHVVLIAAPIFFFVRLFLAGIPILALYHPIKKYAAIIALIGCTLYVALVVPTVPTYRALLMTGIGLIAIMMDRSPFSLRLISFAAIVVLVVAPESIWSASFQLSFAAVLSLIISAEWTREYWSKWRNNAGRTRKFLLYLGGSIFTTLVVSFITAPLASYHFQQIPVYSVVANALLIPLSAIVIMPMTIATFLLWPFGAQDIALKFMGYGIEWMLAIAHGVSSWSGASLHLTAWPLSALVFFILSGLALFLLTGRGKWVAVAGIGIAVMIILFQSKPSFLASQSGNLVMIKDGGDIYLSSAMRDKFAGENWIKRMGKAEGSALVLPREGHVLLSNGSITCGGNMCRATIGDKKISFGNDYYALKQDCDWADIIVTGTAFRDKNCKARINNKFTLIDTGAIQMNEDGKFLTVSQSLGTRPWSPKREKFSDSSGSNLKARPEFEPDPASERAVYKHHSQAPE